MGVFSKILGAGSGKLVKQYSKKVDKINAMEPQIQAMSDEEICSEIINIRRRIAEGKLDADSDSVLIRVFTLGREHIRRTTGKRAYDVQLIGAMALNDGHISEQNTGEGKTLTTFFSILINALAGRQVHVFTVNEYLSKRDAEQCREALAGTGVSIGYIYNQQPHGEKVKAYACDVVYGTPSEFGFDYLRDNMAQKTEDKVQLRHDYAIIDEIDSILIDEARTPLIISGAGGINPDVYRGFARAVRHLVPDEDFDMDEGKKTIAPTERGLRKIEKQLGIDDIYSNNGDYIQGLPRFMKQALTAQFLYHRNRDYIISDREVKIVDPNTGRVMEGRRWSEGLHQAIEAKEEMLGQGVEIQQENETQATVTLQNFFRLYQKLSGCTGTAMTEDAEFRKTYGMGVVAVPTHQPVARVDAPDLVYRTTQEKYDAIADKIAECQAKGQPVLVGTVSVENSEKLSDMLRRRGVSHSVLNARNHEKEAHIIAQAGRLGAVTIATNMAGRGTDIMLGGDADELVEAYKKQVIAMREPDPETGEIDEYVSEEELAAAAERIREICSAEHDKVLAAGGLCVIGSERHESRRIDNQLRGRSGRQGDPGYSQFYISLEDDLMRLFGQSQLERLSTVMKSGFEPGEPMDAPIVSKAIASAQRQVESVHYDARKQTLQYDDVLNKQRLAIYSERDLLMEEDAPIEEKMEITRKDAADKLVQEYCAGERTEWDLPGLANAYKALVGEEIAGEMDWIANGAGMDNAENAANTLLWHLDHDWNEKVDEMGEDNIRVVARSVMLAAVDEMWKDHLNYMSYLKSSIGLRSYGQRDPLTEYKDESYKAFAFMVDTMYEQALSNIMHVKVNKRAANRERESASTPYSQNMFNPNAEISPAAGASKSGGRNGAAIPGSRKKAPRGAEVIERAAGGATAATAPNQRTDKSSGSARERSEELLPEQAKRVVAQAAGSGKAHADVNAGLGDDELIIIEDEDE